MLRIIFIILLLNFTNYLGWAQSCNMSSAPTDKNVLEINFSDVSVKEEGGTSYLYFTIKFKKIGKWYDINGSELTSAAFTSYLSGILLTFDFNSSVMTGTHGVAAIETLETGTFSMMGGVFTGTWSSAYDESGGCSNVQQALPDLLIAKLSYILGSPPVAGLYSIQEDTYALIGKFRWAVKSGVTSGQTGVVLRVGDDAYADAHAFKSNGSNSGNADLGFCVSGESLDIPVGDASVPTISSITGSLAVCEGASSSFTPTVDDATASIAWVVKSDANVDVTSSVVEGGSIASTTGNAAVTFNWSTASAGTYKLCGTPTNSAGAGAEYCYENIVVNAGPALNLAASDVKCAGEKVTLTAVAGMSNYNWYTNGTAVSGATTNKYEPNLPASGATVKYKVTAENAGGCPGADSVTISISPLPVAEILTDIAYSTTTNTTYKVGDDILFKAQSPDESKYTYTWKDKTTGNTIATGTTYHIPGASEAAYNVTLNVEDKTTHCSATDSKELTKNSSCNQSVALAGSAANTICTNGICNITATVQNACSGITITDYVWFKEGVKVDSVSTNSNAKTNVYVANAPGEYSVKVYTTSGYLTQKVTINSSGNTAATIDMPDNYYVQAGKATWLTPECASARSWNWEPKSFIAEGTAMQYAKTKGLSAARTFYVYVEDDMQCLIMDSTKVNISADALVVEIEPQLATVCAGGKTTLLAKVSGGSRPYAYSWTDDDYSIGSTKDSVAIVSDPLASGGVSKIRMLTVTDKNGKTGVASAEVKFVTTANPVLSISGKNSMCENEELTVTKAGGAAVAGYTWYILDKTTKATSTHTGNSLTLKNRGDYRVWVSGATTDGACASDTTGVRKDVKVNGFDLAWETKPADYKLGSTLVAAAKADNGSAPYTYSWSAPAGGKMLTANNVTPSQYQLEGAAAASYHFTVTATDQNSCSKTLDTIVKNTITGGLELLADASVNLCEGGVAVMKATAKGGTAAYTFSWYLPGQESSPLQSKTLASGETSDTYVSNVVYSADQKIIVKLTDNSTPQLIRRDTILIKKRSDLTAPEINAGPDMKIAYNASTWLFASATSGNPTTWYWTDAEKLVNDATLTTAHPKTKNLTGSTTYTVYATDANKCFSNTDEVVIDVDQHPDYKLNVKLDPVTLLCDGSQVNLNAVVDPADRMISAWNWSTTAAGGTFTNNNSATPTYKVNVTADGNADIFVQVTDNAGITATDKISVALKKTTAPVLKLEGYTDKNGVNVICSMEELKVSSTNGVVLSSATWYVGAGANKKQVQTGASMTYKPSSADAEVQTISVEVKSGAGCPASNNVDGPVTVYPLPVLAWQSTAASLLTPGDPVFAVAEITKTTEESYTYSWSHTGAGSAGSYTDPAVATTATTSRSELTSDADAATQPYCFQVAVTDGRGCRSAKIDTTLIIDGDKLLVNLKSKYDAYCVNGAAVLSVTAIGVDLSKATIEWYKNDVLMTGENGQELVVNTPNTTDEYKVVVTAADAKSGEAKLKLTAGTNNAPQISCTDLTIPKGTQTALWVTSPVSIKNWKWFPEDKLAAGESTLQSPYTLKLSDSKTKYKVYAVDGNGCVALDSLNVSTMGLTPPGEPEDQNLMVKIVPQTETICQGNELALNTEVWSTVSGATTYEWEPNDGNLSAYNQASVVFNPANAILAAGTYSYTVKVSKGGFVAAARTDVKVVVGVLPGTPVVASNDNACAGGTLKVSTVQNAKNYIWIVNGKVDTKVTGDSYTWPDVTTPTKYSIQVIAKTADACRSNDTLKLDSIVKPAVSLDGKLHILDTCGQAVVAVDVQNAKISWTIKSGDIGITKNTASDTVTIKKTAFWTNASEAYTVDVEVTPNAGGCKAKDQIKGKFYFKPKAEFDLWIPDGESVGLPYAMVEKDGDRQVSLNTTSWNMATSTGAVNFNWSALHTDATTILDVAGDGVSATYKKAKQDDSVFIRIENKEAAQCMVRDTMPLYLYPEAPTIKIDTVDNSFVKAALYLSGADNYTIWSRKWDPYCLTTAFTGNQVYEKELTGTNITSSIWKEPDMDTLEYYYATSGRTIQGRTWNSKTTSDTVGYYLCDINYNNNLSNVNYLPIYFDFAAMGCPTTQELGLRLKPTSSATSYNFARFVFSTQSTKQTTYLTASPNASMGTKFNITQDLVVIRIQPVQNFSAKFLQYGKLPDASILIDSRNTTTTNTNWAYALPQKADKLISYTALGGELKSEVLGMFTWIFSTQSTNSMTILPTGMVTGQQKPVLKPLLFIKMNPRKTGASYIWK